MKYILPLFLLLLTACGLDASLLNGRWNAVAWYEGGQSRPAMLDSVALIFSDTRHYEFHSLGFYREAGPFRLAGQHLFLTDTTEKTPQEHTLKVLFLSSDTLKIQMSNAGKEQVLFLKKATE